MISKRVIGIQEPLDINFQLIATELDTSVNDMKYLSRSLMSDGLLIDAFDNLVKDIEKEGVEITAFDDNTILYEYSGEAIVVHDILGVKYILFDMELANMLEKKLDEFKN